MTAEGAWESADPATAAATLPTLQAKAMACLDTQAGLGAAALWSRPLGAAALVDSPKVAGGREPPGMRRA